MEEQKIDPHKITKPIQLMAVWFVSLLLLDSEFLASAKLIQKPDWVPAFLVISAVVLVVFFVIGVFFMQTKFRDKLLSDPYYSQLQQMKASKGQTTPVKAAAVSSKFKQRSLMEYMILNTLWTKQVNKWPDLSMYFTFSQNFVTPSEKQTFREAGAKLIGEGLITETENGQYLLTINGFDYCKSHYKEFPKEQWWPDEQINTENLKKVISE